MIQRSFSSGEVDPALYGRADVDRWKAALKQCKNWVVQPEGGLVVRQGFELKGQIPYSDPDEVRLIPFEFGPSDSYVQVFHDLEFNLVRNGDAVYGDIARDAVLNLVPGPHVVTCSAHGYVTGDRVLLYTGSLATNQYYITYIDANSFSLNGTAAGAGTENIRLHRSELASGTPPLVSYVTGGSYPASTMRYVQSGDTQWFTSGDRVPLKVVRNYTQVNSLSIPRELDFDSGFIQGVPTINYVATLSVSSGGGAGTESVRYRVTASDKDGVESACLRATRMVSTSISGTTTLTITKVAHGLLTNDSIIVTTQKFDDYGNILYNAGDVIRIVKTGANTFTIPGPTNGATSANAPLTFARFSASMESVLTPSSSAAATITWSSVAGAATYNVYREFGRVYGYIGSTSATSFIDRGIIPDTKDTPSVGTSPFRGTTEFSGNHPTAVGLFQQRLMFGGFSGDIERITGSHIGNYVTFDPGAEDASGLDFELAGRTVSGIEHMMEIAGRAVALSNTSEWVLRGGTNGGLTTTAINARADSYYGCSGVAPCVVGTSLIYLQRGDRIVREAKYDFSQEALASSDLTLWAKHLFTPEVKRLAYQRTSQILWVLRKDGKLLGLTYIPEQNIWGWHQHVIDGRDIHDICVVSEDGVDRLYCAILDSTNINICRLPLAWESGNVDDHIGFDMALTYDGTLSGTGTLTGGTLWTTAETLTLTASANNFVVGDVGKVFLLRLGDDAVYVTCTAYTSGTEVDVTPDTIVPVALQGVASESIARCAQTFSGLDHLEGETVGVIADGSREPDEVVASGAVTLDGWFARAQVGIIITADAKTLDLEPDDKDTYLGDFKHVTRVYLRVKDTRGLTVGLDATHLESFMPQYTEDMLVNANPALQSGPVEVLMDATHEELGSVLMRQDTGLPATILNARPVFNAGELK